MVLLEVPEGKEIYTSYGESVLSAPKKEDMGFLEPCTHEEADTRLMVHALHATSSGHRKIMIRSNDTDVVVLAISVASALQADEVWVTFGSGKNVQNIPVHVIATSLGPDKATALPLFHALTGCDTVSFFGGRGKKTAWDVWKVFPELTAALGALKASPKEIPDECMAVLERFVVLLYNRTSSLTNVNEVRQELFSKKSRSLDSIPPSRASLEQHVKRAVFQGGYVWGQTLLPQPVLPSPSDWGWKQRSNVWSPYWTALPQAKDTCYELIRCGCRASCRGRCKCVKANLTCTGLCNCGGNCQQS